MIGALTERNHLMRRLPFVLLAVTAWSGDLAAAAAPGALLNKTIATSFSVSIPARAADGSTRNLTRNVTKTIYVSSAGRIFADSARRSGKISQHTQSAPERTASSFRFERSRLIGVLKLGTGASQLAIDFDSGFNSCSARVLTGGAGGSPMTWTGLNGIKYTATGPASASTASCSVTSGNTFAH